MDVKQRKRISQNIDSLVNSTDFHELCEACINNRLLSPTMIQNIRYFEPPRHSNHDYDEDMVQRECHKKLFMKITKRGPDAFEKLRRIFIELKYEEALKILFDADEGMISISSSKRTGIATSGNGDINLQNIGNSNDAYEFLNGEILRSSSTDDNNNVTLQEYEGVISPKKNITVRKGNRIIIDPKMGTYLMESKNKRGIFFLVSSDQPQQLELNEDDHSLLSLFQQLGFKLYAYSNIKLNTFFELLNDLLSSDQIDNIECFVLALRAGGRLINGVQCITFNDGAVVKVEQIQKYFYHQSCKKLVGKPKIFIYPYSEVPNRGVIRSDRIQTDSQGYEGMALKHVPQLSDVISCYATTKGFMDKRDKDNYSCYIQNFTDVMAERACDTHFEDILKKIHDNVVKMSLSRGQLQMPSYDNISFNKLLYFNPGINY